MPSSTVEETMNSANNSDVVITDDAAVSPAIQLVSGNIATQQPQQLTAGKTKRDDEPATDNLPPSPPLPEPQRAAPPYIDVAFTATVQHHVTAFVTWHEPEARPCDSGAVTSSGVVGYRLRYVNAATSTPTETNVSSNVAVIDDLMPSAEYWYQLQYLFDDGSHSPWTEKQLLET